MTTCASPIHPNLIHRLLVRQDVSSIDLSRDSAVVHTGDRNIEVSLAGATLRTTWSLLGTTAVLQTGQGSFTIRGLSAWSVAVFTEAVTSATRRRALLQILTIEQDQADAVARTWDDLETRDQYLAQSDLSNWQAAAQSLTVVPTDDADLLQQLPESAQHRKRRIDAVLANPRGQVDQRNDMYCTRQLAEHAGYFDTVESNPLTDQQRFAVVCDEDNALVLAGAGTGKTSTVVAKVGFILRKKWANPNEILLLAFTKKAAEEMQQRIKNKLGVLLEVRTFHSLGSSIIGKATGKKPSLCPEADDALVRSATIEGIIGELLADVGFRFDLLKFQSALKRPYKPEWAFQSLSEYTKYRLEVELRTLKGHLVQSYAECDIANWLYINGISYEYERLYEVDLATPDKRQYKPDFYLCDYGIYIEHWGIARDGGTAPYVDQATYTKRMAWARSTHSEHETVLVETYSWQRQDGTLLAGLEDTLTGLGVELKPISASQALEALNKGGRTAPFITIIGTFISLFKSSGRNSSSLVARAEITCDKDRAVLFVKIFEKIFARYEECIHEKGEIDFDDMIAKSCAIVQSGTYQSPFKYLLVDEFQDIAQGRANLILALRDQVLGSKLFTVGDDWQSIYRFSGSDISLTTRFADVFGHTKTTTLDRTFRFHDKLADYSSRFVQANPHQLRKKLTTATSSSAPAVVICKRETSANPIPEILAEIRRQDRNSSVFILGRYNHELPKDIAGMSKDFSSLRIAALTAHSSKGLEADYVIITGVKRGKYGFPSEMADDSVLAMVLPDDEAFPFAEERRLFYVALTRARKRVFIIADTESRSSFLTELLSDHTYCHEVHGSMSESSSVCPVCESGTVKKQEGSYGVFFGCSNFPICTYKATLCPSCKGGSIRREKDRGACSSCGHIAWLCPKCGEGMLLQRQTGKNGRSFLGCSQYGSRHTSCDYTQNI